jgi:hypothetical protein
MDPQPPGLLETIPGSNCAEWECPKCKDVIVCSKQPVCANCGTAVAPHRPGDVVPVREEWRPDFAEADILYRDGTSKRFIDEPWFEQHAHWSLRQERVGWQPANTLPDFAVRRYQRILSIRPVLASKVTEAEAERMGFTIDTSPCDHKRQLCKDVGCFGQTRVSSLVERVGGPSIWLWVWEEEQVHA